ncbi:hypothetical protein SM62_04574 [Klebsiella variicola]|uniref:hypothetical protein n=1 Tax=Klebsiella TaxID=570 RepID=UPI0006597482|nr:MULTISPECIES: hypothetical protein [Klebsiella]KMG93742.1 hypothetical protein SM62_04574 [Klebsiella variicola]
MKAAYQARFVVGQPITFKPNAQQQKALVEASRKAGQTVEEYANYALVANLKEEEQLKI